MGSPRRLLRYVTRRSRRTARLVQAEPATPAITLETMRRRLELMLAAIYGRPMRIVPARPPRHRAWYGRILRPVPRHLREPRGAMAQAGSDGIRIVLPPELAPGAIGAADAAASANHYKLLALEQAERLHRGTSRLVPNDDTPLERDLYPLSESIAVDRALVALSPNLAPQIAAERTRALQARPEMSALTPAEREMEALVRAALSAPPGHSIPEVPDAETAAQSRDWARAHDRAMRGTHRSYRGLPIVRVWGAVRQYGGGPKGVAEQPWELASANYRFVSEGEGPNEGGSTPDPERSDAPTEAAPPDEVEGAEVSSMEPAEDKGDATEAAPTGAEASSFDADAAGAPSPTTAAPAGESAEEVDRGIPYPEWDYLDQQYAERPALVRLRAPIAATDAWAAEALDRYAPVVRRLRERFDKLRARRIRLARQRDGDELDVAACIEAYVDSRTGHAVGDRIYSSVRPARRALAIMLLVDISGSTDEKIRDEQRVIDVAKLALLIVTQALDALGDPYAIVTFSGRGREHVRMRLVKDFADPSGDAVRQGIAGLAPEGYTRAGAAIRHATAMMLNQPAGHRLLLMLSDGKPNDEDGYSGRYAVEDTRQAILEAQGRGIHSYCLTIDRKAHDYLTRIFGESGHTILQHPEQLPLALSDVVRRLLGAGA